MSLRTQNQYNTRGRVPGWYANNKLYPYANAPTQAPTRTSRRMHEGLSIDRNYGLDTTSDDLNSSPYSSPYYINGRYNSDNLTTQTGNSASVQGTKLLLVVPDTEKTVESASSPETYLKLWQGKQIRFKVRYTNKLTGATLTLRNTGGCRGILSIYFSATPTGPVLGEVAVDLCAVNQDNYEHKRLYLNTPIPVKASPRGVLYVRMEIWDELTCKRQTIPFNTETYIEIAASGQGNHEECLQKFEDKNKPVRESYEFTPKPSQPVLGFIYNDWESVPTDRIEGVDYGATVSKNGYRYDIFCIKTSGLARIVVYDRQTNTTVPNALAVDSRAQHLYLVQAGGEVYYVDGYSPLRKFTVGDWKSYTFPTDRGEDAFVSLVSEDWFNTDLSEVSGLYSFVYHDGNWQREGIVTRINEIGLLVTGSPADGDIIQVNSVNDEVGRYATATYLANRPVVAPSLITFHANRIWLSGFRYDPNLVQYSDITDSGPEYSSFVWRFYVPDQSPLATSDAPITAMVEYQPDRLMFANANRGYSLYATTADPASELPTQVSIHSESAGVRSAGDITNYNGVVYSFDPDEGIRRFTGSIWHPIPANLSSYYERVDLDKPRKLWGYAQKLYLNYTDKVDGKAKCLIWDMAMNYQQYPWFQDADIPFCDVRASDDYDLIGIHPDSPCIMQLYAYDTWRRLDSPIVFRRDAKYLNVPGNAAELILKRVFIKVLANTNRWWWVGLSFDRNNLNPDRGVQAWYRLPSWATKVKIPNSAEPFAQEDVYEQYATSQLALPNLNAQVLSVQVRVMAKTFRSQANYVSLLLEGQPRPYN